MSASRIRSVLGYALVGLVLLPACGGDDDASDPVGRWTHPEEGAVVISDDGTGTIEQSGDGIAFTWSEDDGSVVFDLDDDPDNEPDAVASLDGDELTFRAGDYSGDEPVVFTRE